MSPTFRQARPEDATGIATLHHRAGEAAYRGVLPDALLDELTPEVRARRWNALLADAAELCWVMVSDSGRLLGFAHASAADGPQVASPAIAIHSLYVDPDRVGSGLGSRLLEELVGTVRERGAREVVLWVLETNARGVAFYTGHGFVRDERVAVREHKGTGMRVLRLRRPLDEPMR